MDGDEDTFTSVNWDADSHNVHIPGTSLPRTPHRTASTTGTSPGGGQGTSSTSANAGALAGIDPASLAKKAARGNEAEEEYKRTPRWEGFLMVQVTEPRKEQEGTKEVFVSYGIRAEVSKSAFDVRSDWQRQLTLHLMGMTDEFDAL
jgi:sorting nexin-4